MTNNTECQVLYRPPTNGLRFLPEGPQELGPDRFSWVAIQHGKNSLVGSLNILDVTTGTNTSHELPGRPGFAHPTDTAGLFLCGVERTLGLYDLETKSWQPLAENIDDGVDGTIINDAVSFEENVIFGCKDLQFEQPKAGLYLWRSADQRLIRLRSDQTCSNGKVIIRRDGQLVLLDIDTPTKCVARYEVDIAAGTLGPPTTVLDLNDLEMYPDGMILAPDQRSVIIAFYNPNDSDYGEARLYDLETASVRHTWQCPLAPQVTCPQLVTISGRRTLVLTTAVEHMSPTRQQWHSNSGALFVGQADFLAGPAG